MIILFSSKTSIVFVYVRENLSFLFFQKKKGQITQKEKEIVINFILIKTFIGQHKVVQNQ